MKYSTLEVGKVGMGFLNLTLTLLTSEPSVCFRRSRLCAYLPVATDHRDNGLVAGPPKGKWHEKVWESRDKLPNELCYN